MALIWRKRPVNGWCSLFRSVMHRLLVASPFGLGGIFLWIAKFNEFYLRANQQSRLTFIRNALTKKKKLRTTVLNHDFGYIMSFSPTDGSNIDISYCNCTINTNQYTLLNFYGSFLFMFQTESITAWLVICISLCIDVNTSICQKNSFPAYTSKQNTKILIFTLYTNALFLLFFLYCS